MFFIVFSYRRLRGIYTHARDRGLHMAMELHLNVFSIAYFWR